MQGEYDPRVTGTVARNVTDQLLVRWAAMAAGAVCGVLSTYPSELRFLPSILLWGGVGVLIGLFARARDAVWTGALYGLFLLVGFFATRLAVSSHSIHRPLFDVLAVVFTPLGAIVAVYAGSKLRRDNRGV